MTEGDERKPKHVEAALRAVASLDDPARLRRMMRNATDMGVDEVRVAAFRRLMDIQTDGEEGPFAQDAWKSIHALEEIRTQERGRTVRLSRTRQKIGRDGIRTTLEHLAGADTGTDGFRMLIDRGLPELTFEAIVLKHPQEFDAAVLSAARRRLEAEGVDVDATLVRARGR